MRKLQIAYTMQNVGFDISSSVAQAILVKSLIRGLRQSGHAVDLISLHGRDVTIQERLDASDAGRRTPLGITGKRPFLFLESGVRRLQGELRLPYFALFDSLRFYEACRRALPPYDLCHEYAGSMSVGTAWACRRLGIPYVLTVDADLLLEAAVTGSTSSGLQRQFARWAAQTTYRLADQIITVSQQTKERLMNIWQVDAAKINVIPNGVDIHRFAPQQDRQPIRHRLELSDELVIMFVGGFYPWHGVDILVESFAQVVNSMPNARLLLVGDGPVRAQIEAQIDRSGLGEKTLLTGMISHDRVPEMLAAADVVTLPYPELPEELWFSPLKLYEYMAAGKAIIASNAGQIPQVIKHNHSGILLEPGNVDLLAQFICILLQDADLRDRLGQNARKQAVAHHSWESQIEKLESVYQRVL